MKTEIMLTLTFEDYWFGFDKTSNLPSIPPVGTLIVDAAGDHELSFTINEGDAAYFINDNTIMISHEKVATTMEDFLNVAEACAYSKWVLSGFSKALKTINKEYPKIDKLTH